MPRYALTPRSARCPACHNEDGLFLYGVDAGQAAQHFVLRQSDPERHDALRRHIESLWRRPTCDLVRCRACGFTFAEPYVAGDARFYDLAYQRTGYPAWKWEYARTLSALETLKPELGDFHLLEVGAGDGAFVRRVSPGLTPPPHVVCTEFSDYGIEEIRRQGFACLPEDVRNLPLDSFGGRFDVVCLFQVLEHLDGLDQLFDHLRRLTRDAAHVFVAVPNDRRIAFNEEHGSLLDMPPNHVGRWTRGAFEAIAQRHGWRLLAHEVETEPAVSKAKTHVAYRYVRRRQDPASLANRVERVGSKPVKRLLQVATAGLYGIGALPSIVSLVRGEHLGDSQWVHLQKT
jgi:SAM-dependent methyltransferase